GGVLDERRLAVLVDEAGVGGVDDVRVRRGITERGVLVVRVERLVPRDRQRRTLNDLGLRRCAAREDESASRDRGTCSRESADSQCSSCARCKRRDAYDDTARLIDTP